MTVYDLLWCCDTNNVPVAVFDEKDDKLIDTTTIYDLFHEHQEILDLTVDTWELNDYNGGIDIYTY